MHGAGRQRSTWVHARWVGALLVAAVFAVAVALPAALAAPAPKPGKACPTLGNYADYSLQGERRHLVCVKSGKKTVWKLEAKQGAKPTAVEKQGAKPTAVEKQGKAVSGSVEPSHDDCPTATAQGCTSLIPGSADAICAKNGQVRSNGLAGIVCREGKWRWATYDDAPKGPFAKRPAWYPPLNLGRGSAGPPCPTKGVVLTHSFVPENQLVAIEPYGLAIYDHVTPIDHAYVSLAQWSKPKAQWSWQPVMSPADGVISEVGSLGTGLAVTIDHGCGVYTRYMVLERLSGVLAQADPQRGLSSLIPVKAGQEFGQQRTRPLDFNVFEASKWLKGLNPFSYLSGDSFKLHTADPSGYFTPRLAALYESVLLRTQKPRWGKIDLDLAGRAQGNWYLRETNGYACMRASDLAGGAPRGGALPQGKRLGSWCHLALVPHAVDTSAWVASFGWWEDAAGDGVQLVLKTEGNPTPAELRVASGTVVYEVGGTAWLRPDGTPLVMMAEGTISPVGYRVAAGETVGLVALRVNADDSLTVETLPGATQESQFTGFTVAARTYVH